MTSAPPLRMTSALRSDDKVGGNDCRQCAISRDAEERFERKPGRRSCPPRADAVGRAGQPAAAHHRPGRGLLPLRRPRKAVSRFRLGTRGRQPRPRARRPGQGDRRTGRATRVRPAEFRRPESRAAGPGDRRHRPLEGRRPNLLHHRRRRGERRRRQVCAGAYRTAQSAHRVPVVPRIRARRRNADR